MKQHKKTDMELFERECEQLAGSIYGNEQDQFQKQTTNPIVWALVFIAAVLGAGYFIL